MTEKPTLNLKGCQHLRKVLIGERVDFKGKIDLSDTSIDKKIDVKTVPTDRGSFKNIPNGISVDRTRFNQVRFKSATVETQTDPVEIMPLEKLELMKYDQDTLAIL